MNETFYADLAAHYHLLFHDWAATVRRQGEVLQALLAQAAGDRPLRVLDAACGIGTQAIGLALQGHAVTGSDLSAPAVERAQREAKRFGVDLQSRQADMRQLDTVFAERFDVVLVMDNSLAHLMTQEDLTAAMRAVCAVLAPDGVLVASVRDYDRLRAVRPSFTSARVMDAAGERRIAFQTWDWSDDGVAYDLTQYLVRDGPGGPKVMKFVSEVHAVTRAAVTAACDAAGFAETTWYEGPDIGFYQPVLMAR